MRATPMSSSATMSMASRADGDRRFGVHPTHRSSHQHRILTGITNARTLTF